MDIYLYDEILPGAAERVATQLAGAAGPVTVRINSPGGSATEGLAIYNALSRYALRVEVHIDGLAASIASLIAMAGDRVYIARSALLMIHAPWVAGLSGDARELRRAAEALDASAEAMVAAYASKTRKSREAILELMLAETWLTAEQAVAEGFADELVEPLPMAAAVRCFDLSGFRHPPIKEFAMPEVPKTPDPLAAERARTAAIRQVFALFPDYRGVEADCLADMTVTEAEARKRLLAEMGRGGEPLGGHCRMHMDRHLGYGPNSHHGEFRAAARDAILTRYGVTVPNPHPAAADVMGMSITDIAKTLLAHTGRAPLMRTKGAIIKAALTTSDFPGLLEDIAEKAAMTGFRALEVSTHRAWTRASTLSDFKPASRVALSEAPGLEEVPEAAEFKHGALSDAKEPIQLATYGRIVSISRQALINDDLGELARMPEALGQAAARLEADLVYGLLTGNPTMRDGVALFHADHGNLAGTGAALSVASLGAARAAMRKQTGLGGEGYLNITPKFLIVPAALETVAEQLMVSIQATTTAAAVPAWVSQLTVVADPRLDDASETAWYLAGNPAAHDTIEVALLDGQQPFVDQQDGFSIDAVKFKVRIDVGAAAVDWRALYQNPGA